MHSEATLIGHLGDDLKLHTDPKKKSFATLSLASHRRLRGARNAEGQARDTPHDRLSACARMEIG
jgi:hypothetical protein